MQWRRLIGFGSGCVMFFLLGALFGGDARADGVHRCSGAGKWFPDDPRELRTTIEKYLDAAEAPEIQGQLRAIVVPHAGYQYSGATAAHAYKLLQGREIRRVIILAFSHSTRISGASVLDVDAYETPLGSVAVDREAVAALLENEDFKTVQAAHRTEHSDENQLPFLQCVLGEDFKIVSILVGPGPMTEKEDLERLHRIAEAIRPLMDDRTLLVASSVLVAWAGGFLLIWLYGRPWFLDFSLFGVSLRELFQVHPIHLSVAIWVGFLALFGIASDDGVVMATYLDQTFATRRIRTKADVREATVEAAGRRIRPCLMTSATTILALIPVLTSTGRGSDVMVPMAIPVFGGMLVVLVSEFVVPELYCAIKERRLSRHVTQTDERS